MGLLDLLWTPLGLGLRVIEQMLFILINLYDRYCYSPLQVGLSPLVAKVPRSINIGGQKVTVFSANIVSWSRTALIIPIAWCLKYDYNMTAFLCVLFHDFLDHLDGIVAKVQKSIFGQLDDPLLGGFMDAFCDKIVNCISLWTILLVTDFSHMTSQQTWVLFSACAVIIAYEFVLGVVRVQDYFQAYYSRKYNKVSKETQPNVSAVMEGKLKEKLESLGIGCLCLAQSSRVPLTSAAGITGVTCLLLSIRLAHASLMHKLRPRLEATVAHADDDADKVKPEDENKPTFEKISFGVQTDDQIKEDSKRNAPDLSDSDNETTDMSEEEEEKNDKLVRTRQRSRSSWTYVPKKVDRVYTVGCFDLFHEGHVKLLTRLRNIGTQYKKDVCCVPKVIVGVHDSRSIFKLKKKIPIDSTCRRMMNVKRFADVVFCIRGTDPTPFLHSIFDATAGGTSMYVRGDDMPNFPARDFLEKLMPIHFLPYTASVSSTKIRKEVYNSSMFGPHVVDDNHDIFY